MRINAANPKSKICTSGNFSEVQCILMARVHEATREYGQPKGPSKFNWADERWAFLEQLTACKGWSTRLPYLSENKHWCWDYVLCMCYNCSFEWLCFTIHYFLTRFQSGSTVVRHCANVFKSGYICPTLWCQQQEESGEKLLQWRSGPQ